MPVPHRNYANARAVMLSGRLDHANCEGFRSDLAQHLDGCAAEKQPLILDLSRLEYVSSAGLRCLMLTAKDAGVKKVRMVVAGMQPVVAEIFQISRFHLVFDIFPSLRDALATVSPEAAQAFDRG